MNFHKLNDTALSHYGINEYICLKLVTRVFRKVIKESFSLPVGIDSPRDVTEKMAESKWRLFRISKAIFGVQMRSHGKKKYGFVIPF